jgi:stage V sporulation protein D (sporulation-specific penicillin-binding protein)
MKNVDVGFMRRALFATLAIILAFSLLCFRILAYQTYGYEKYRGKVIEQLTTKSPSLAKRGMIYDSSGRLLATNKTSYRVFISPSAISAAQKALDQKATSSISERISKSLSEALGMDYDKIYEKTKKSRRLDETIAKSVDEETASRVRNAIIEERFEHLVFLEASDVRYYPYGSLASHVIGFTGADGTGLYGLEHQYNDSISGDKGYYVTARDSRGNELPNQYNTYIDSQKGYSMTLTLDAYVQAALEEQLENAVVDSGALNRACGMVMDVHSGAILAMSVYPEFDLNDPWKLVEYYEEKLRESGLAKGSEEYSALSSQYLLESWSNKALTETYIPGSTFKIITSSMALEENLPILNSNVYCGGVKTVLGKGIHCHKRTGHGSLSFAQGVQHSCNVWFMSIGERLGSAKFMEYFKLFGYREKTGIDLPGEGMGVISSKMSELDLAIYAFGQNFTVTAIQHLSAIAAVANGGELVKPYLVQSMSDRDGNVVFNRETQIKRRVMSENSAKRIAEILAEGVAGVGGAKNAYVAGYRVAAKTGTSEKKGKTTTGEEMYICSCVAFAPADDPQIAIIIMVDEPTKGILYGSTVAAPYIAKTLETVLPYLGVEPIYTEEEKKLLDKEIKN